MTEMLPELAALGSALGGLGGLAAAVVATKALRANRRAAVAAPLLDAFGELFAAVTALGDRAVELATTRDGEATSRTRLAADFHRLEVAVSRIDLLEPALSRRRKKYGRWLKDAVRNLAATLLQADEFGDIARRESRRGRPERKPDWVDTSEWEYLGRSLGFFGVETLCEDLPPRGLPWRVESPDRWWGRRVLQFHDAGFPSVYSLDAPYLTQNARLLDDFAREYLTPWAQDFLGQTLLGRAPRGRLGPAKRSGWRSARAVPAPCAVLDDAVDEWTPA